MAAKDLLGMRRLDWVRVDSTGPVPTYEVVGINHRIPVALSIPPSMAYLLIDEGVPVVVKGMNP